MIVGAEPAAWVAGITARQADLRTLVIAGNDTDPPIADTGWLGPAGVQVCHECGVELSATGGVEFAGLRLWPWNLKADAMVDGDELTGWLVQPDRLLSALGGAAQSAGTEVLTSATLRQLDLGEACVTAHLSDGRAVTGRILLIADGPAAAAAQMARLETVPRESAPGAMAGAVFQIPRTDPTLDVVIGTGRDLQLATIVRFGTTASVTLLTRSTTSPAPVQLAELLDAARAVDRLPGTSTITPQAAVSRSGVALELDSHVGKRCLLMGAAGGFVSSFSNDGLYPALRSAQLAAQTAARALKAELPQDELASFSSAWQSELADYLRMPNTDLGLLMPMVFGNPRMSERVARAFLLGQSF